MNKYAYVTLLVDDPNYINGVLLLRESLARVKSKYPLYVCVTPNLSEKSKHILKEADIQTILLPDNINTPSNIYEHNKKVDPMRADIWKNTFNKFGIFSLTEFDKIIYCDSDLLFYKNVDHCFELPHMSAAVDGEYFNLWSNWKHFNSGFMVIKPEKELKDKLVDYLFTLPQCKIDTYREGTSVIADQDILNMYYNDWPDRPELHLNKWYNVFNIHTHKSDCEHIVDNAYFVHFVGTKPWQTILDTGVSTLTLNNYNLGGEESCCIAYSIIQLCYKNKLKPLDWEMLEETGEYYYTIACTAINYFHNGLLASKYIDKALNIEKHPEYLKLKNTIELVLKAQALQPLIQGIYDKLYMEALKDNKCTFPYYIVDQIYGPYMKKGDLEQLNLTLETWETIKNAIYSMMETKYKNKF